MSDDCKELLEQIRRIKQICKERGVVFISLPQQCAPRTRRVHSGAVLRELMNTDTTIIFDSPYLLPANKPCCSRRIDVEQ